MAALFSCLITSCNFPSSILITSYYISLNAGFVQNHLIITYLICDDFVSGELFLINKENICYYIIWYVLF